MGLSNGSSIDELKYATDTRNFRDAVLQDNIPKTLQIVLD